MLYLSRCSALPLSRFEGTLSRLLIEVCCELVILMSVYSDVCSWSRCCDREVDVASGDDFSM